jgi:hypothetical protein
MQKNNIDSMFAKAFQENEGHIDDDGFTEKVVAGLHEQRPLNRVRFTVYGTVILASLAILFISFKSLINILADAAGNVIYSIINLKLPPFMSILILVIMVLGSIGIIIIENEEIYDRNK